jgi:hypothetical protein
MSGWIDSETHAHAADRRASICRGITRAELSARYVTFKIFTLNRSFLPDASAVFDHLVWRQQNLRDRKQPRRCWKFWPFQLTWSFAERGVNGVLFTLLMWARL